MTVQIILLDQRTFRDDLATIKENLKTTTDTVFIKSIMHHT